MDKNTKKWSTVVTSNIPGQDIEQEVRYSDPPKVQLKVMETNYENLKPNLKIKIPSKNNSDEDWNDEAVDLDISPKIPTTMKGYVKWNKNVEQQYGLDKGDAKRKTICSQTSESTVDIELAKSFSSGSGDSPQHLYNQSEKSLMNINNDVTSDTKKKNERTSSHKITCNREDNEKNVWEITTNEKWGNSNYIHENQTSFMNRNACTTALSDMTKFLNKGKEFTPKPLLYKQKSMKSVSKKNEQAIQTKTDINHNVQQTTSENQNIKHLSSANLDNVQDVNSSTPQIVNSNKHINKNSLQNVTSTKSTKSLSTQMSVTKNQTCTENWEDDLIEIPVQMVVTGENPISRNQHQHEWSINYENLAKPEKIENTQVMQESTTSNHVENKDMQRIDSGENWNDGSIVVTHDKALSKTCHKMENINTASVDTSIGLSKRGENMTGIGENHHRLPVLKNLSTNPDENIEIPSCRLPRLPRLSGNKAAKYSTPISNDKQDTLGCHGNEKTQIETQDSMHRQTPPAATTIQQDLDRIMANMNMSSASLNMPFVLPPYLVQAYMQFLSSGNNAPFGMMPNLANMPLLPGLLPIGMQNPLLASSPVLAYSLQQQQIAAMNKAMSSGGKMMGQNIQATGNGLLDMNINMSNNTSNVEQRHSSLCGNVVESGQSQQSVISVSSAEQPMTSVSSDTKDQMLVTESGNVNSTENQNNDWSIDVDIPSSALHPSTLHDRNIAPIWNEKNLHTNSSPSSAFDNRHMNLPSHSIGNAVQKDMMGTGSRSQSDHPSYSKFPYDLQRKREQMQAVQAMINSLKKEPDSLVSVYWCQ